MSDLHVAVSEAIDRHIPVTDQLQRITTMQRHGLAVEIAALLDEGGRP